MDDNTQDAVARALNKDPAQEQLLLERVKQDLRELIEEVDAGNFRGAIVTIFNPQTKNNHVKLWGDRSIVNESAIRVLHNAGVLRRAGP